MECSSDAMLHEAARDMGLVFAVVAQISETQKSTLFQLVNSKGNTLVHFMAHEMDT